MTQAFTPPARAGTCAVPYVTHPQETHTLRWVEWGDAASTRVVVCVHGLTRNARDFDALASALAAEYRVISLNMPGRSTSDWLAHSEEYALPFYLANVQAWWQHLQLKSVYWVGTSMGGMLGMLLAASNPAWVRALVLNDVGPYIPQEALARIGAYVGKNTRFETRALAEAAMRKNYAPFGIQEEAHWQHLFTHGLIDAPGGGVQLTYDPAIAVPFETASTQAIDLWPVWQQITCPTLVIRGALSDVLLHDTATAMQQSRPHVTLNEVPGVGHAPALMNTHDIQVIARWLASKPKVVTGA